MRKNFRSDISIRESFYDYDQSGERIQSLVPENVRIEYFTPAYQRVRLVCSRNGDTFHNCSLSENGRVLVCNLALSRKSLGVGPLLKIVKHSVADSSFPYDFQNKEHIASTGIDLWGGPSDAGELESESVLSEVILRYGYSAYRLAVLDGFEGTEQEWLESLIGPQGKSAYKVAVDNGFEGTVAEWLASLVGAPGKSAYQVAVENGFEGTEAEWLESLIGPQGKSAYQVAVDNGFEGTVAEWLASLIGPQGKSAYQVAVDNGFEGTEQEWLESLIGPQGKSAYQVAVDNGFEGTVAEWLASLKGPAGDSAYEVAVQEGFVGTKAQWLASLVGPQGLSAYQVAVVEGFEGSVSDWLASLVGPPGDPGITDVSVSVDNNYGTPSATATIVNKLLQLAFYNLKGDPGQSAYALAVALGYTGTEEEWIESIHGAPGVGFDDASTPAVADGTLIITLSNGDQITVDLNHNHLQYYSKEVETSQPQGGFLPDVIYKLGTLTGSVTFALAAAVTGNANHYFIVFETGSAAPTIIWPAGITWASGSAPAPSANKHCEVSIMDGIAAYLEV